MRLPPFIADRLPVTRRALRVESNAWFALLYEHQKQLIRLRESVRSITDTPTRSDPEPPTPPLSVDEADAEAAVSELRRRR